MTDGFATGDGMADGTLAIGDDGFAEAVMESDGALGEKARGQRRLDTRGGRGGLDDPGRAQPRPRQRRR